MKNLATAFRPLLAGLALSTALGWAPGEARAQDAAPPPAPSPAPPPAPAPAPAPVPSPTAPAASPAPVEDRLRQLEERYEAMERRHAQSYRELQEKYESLRVASGGESARPSRAGEGAQGMGGRTNPDEATSGGAGPAGPAVGGGTGRGRSGQGAQGTGGRTNPDEVGSGRPTPREAGGTDAQGTDARTFVRENTADEKPLRRPAKVSFAEGLEFASEDDEFKLTFHDLTQAEYRGFPRNNQGTLQSQFFVPRQRWYFTGQVTRNVEFYTSINRGYGSLDLLDAFITLNLLESLTNHASDMTDANDPYGAQGEGGRASASRGRGSDDRLRFRVGRMKTPYLYEYFSIAEGDLIAPERSLFAGNLAGNRQVGAMFLGELFDRRLGYAAGIFNGDRRSFGDFNSDKDLFLYLNGRPFLKSEDFPFLHYLNIGTSMYGGDERNVAQPNAFRTANDQTTSAAAASLSPTFLTLNNNVTELGERMQWSAHLAYFYESLTLLAEYGGGYQGYSNNGHTSVRTPYSGWMIQGTYFLTGEKLTRRVNVVRPIKKFGYDKGKFGLGAFEVHARFSDLELGRQVFTGGFADPNEWSNRAYAIDTGVNWYWNYYTKIYFDWQHGMYGNPITSGPGGHLMSSTDLFWLRFQVFF